MTENPVEKSTKCGLKAENVDCCDAIMRLPIDQAMKPRSLPEQGGCRMIATIFAHSG
jgi:hypothetical protein